MKKSVMIVDEGSNVLERVKAFLEEENVDVTTVRTNKEAMEILEKERSIDAVLLHTKMPDGKEVFVPLVRKNDKALPLDMEISPECGKKEIIRFLSEISNL